MIYFIALMAFGACLAFLVLEDVVHSRVHLEALPLFASCSVFVTSYFGVAWQDVLSGTALWAILFLAFKFVRFPLRGWRDALLILIAGFFLSVSPVAISAVVFLVMCCAGLFVARYVRKRGFRLEHVPLAAPICATVFVILEWRVFGDSIDQGFAVGSALELLTIPIFGIVLGGMFWTIASPPAGTSGGDHAD